MIAGAGVGNCTGDDHGRGVEQSGCPHAEAVCSGGMLGLIEVSGTGCIRWITHGVGKTQRDKFVVDEGIAHENVTQHTIRLISYKNILV